MKSIYHITLTALTLSVMACTEDFVEKEKASSGEEFNIEAFSEGYSVAFEMSLDRMGGGDGTKAGDIDDARIEAWENYVNPEEFRILFFDKDDHFLFESKTRWFTSMASYDGGSRWRVGVPIFSYLSDSYDENISTSTDFSVDESYNWDRIMEIMRSQSFKVAILANRPSDIAVPELSDLTEDERDVDSFGLNGPFWSPKNSIASYTDAELQDHWDDIRTVFDLHHCQYDPFYENKNTNGGPYTFIMKKDKVTVRDKATNTMVSRSGYYMGAVSSWLHPDRERRYGGSTRYFYRLPESQILNVSSGNDFGANRITKNQYIPMYGIQKFDALTKWTKGSTYNLSGQTGSQTGDYDYKSISLLRSVVKLELRIPKLDKNGNSVIVDNEWAQICANNFLARCEPMDVWTPTNLLWKNHNDACEWRDIRAYGLYADDSNVDYRVKLSWFYGAWEKDEKWSFGDVKVVPETETTQYPRIFNPITQRLQLAFITDCYFETEAYHRWIIYCGEKNMNDPNDLNNLSSEGYVNFFRIRVKRGSRNEIYHMPITDYSSDKNPIKDYLVQSFSSESDAINKIKEIGSYPTHMSDRDGNSSGKNYYKEIKNTDPKNYPYPLLRNHMYRLTVSFGDGDDINVKMIDGEKRVVGGIEFN